MKYKAVVIGTSAGGMEALRIFFENLKSDFKLPILIVQHVSPYSDNYIVEYLGNITELNVNEANEKEKIKSGNVYFAPPNYHLLVELDETMSLTVEEKVAYARPSVDVLFETAAACYKEKLLGIVLTGANFDGTFGCKQIKEYGGHVITQSLDDSEVDSMPRSVIENVAVDFVGSIKEITELLNKIEVEYD